MSILKLCSCTVFDQDVTSTLTAQQFWSVTLHLAPAFSSKFGALAVEQLQTLQKHHSLGLHLAAVPGSLSMGVNRGLLETENCLTLSCLYSQLLPMDPGNSSIDPKWRGLRSVFSKFLVALHDQVKPRPGGWVRGVCSCSPNLLFWNIKWVHMVPPKSKLQDTNPQNPRARM